MDKNKKQKTQKISRQKLAQPEKQNKNAYFCRSEPF